MEHIEKIATKGITLTTPAKINLGLNITQRRADGYHDLETVFFPVPSFSDTLSFTVNDQRKEGCTLSMKGIEIQGEASDNLVCRAYRLLDAEFHLPPVDIMLEKHIPTQAGMGGGSSDCAATVLALNKLFALGLSIGEMQKRVATLGADCAFFINPTPSYAIGIGEILTPIPLTLCDCHIEVVKPNVSVSTREAFQGIRPRKPEYNCREIVLNTPVEAWRDTLRNDFEETIFPLHPELVEIKQDFYRRGAAYAAMSGSGSAIFGIFRDEK